MSTMKRRKFIGLLGGAVVLPLAAHAQERVRRVGVLMGYAEADPDARSSLEAFRQVLQGLGWTEGRNVQFHYRWAAADAERRRIYAAELVELTPDVILAHTLPVAAALKQASTAIPIVFASGGDPITSGLVSNLARPGGNVTGFPITEPSMGGKWLELLKELSPAATRAAVVLPPENPNRAQYLQAIAAANTRLQMQLVQLDAHDEAAITRAIDAFADGPNGALLVLPGASTSAHRRAIVAAANRGRLPAIYPFRFYAVEGGLAAYGADQLDLFRRAASYVDRILRGEMTGDLPVQQPTKFELIINLKTAKALGITIPLTLQAAADEVIE